MGLFYSSDSHPVAVDGIAPSHYHCRLSTPDWQSMSRSLLLSSARHALEVGAHRGELGHGGCRYIVADLLLLLETVALGRG